MTTKQYIKAQKEREELIKRLEAKYLGEMK
jgi:hypothetical protein